MFANIVRNACLGSFKTYYPEEVFGKMCTEKNKKIVSEYIPHLIHELKTAERLVITLKNNLYISGENILYLFLDF